MAPSAYHPGQHLDELLDRLKDMGAPSTLPPKAQPIQWGRVAGEQKIWLRVLLPARHIGTVNIAETWGDTLDQAARTMIDIELTAADIEVTESANWLDKHYGATA